MRASGRGVLVKVKARISKVSATWLVLGLAVTLGAIASLPPERAAVIVPALLVALIAGWFWSALRARDRGGLATLELGSVFAAVIALYALFPIASYAANGFDFKGVDDYRLSAINPSSHEVGSLLWLHVTYLAAFAVSYLLARGRAGLRPGAAPSPGGPTLAAAVALLAGVQGFLLALYLAYGLHAATYMGSYLVVYKLPLLLRQLYNHLQGVSFVCQDLRAHLPVQPFPAVQVDHRAVAGRPLRRPW